MHKRGLFRLQEALFVLPWPGERVWGSGKLDNKHVFTVKYYK